MYAIRSYYAAAAGFGDGAAVFADLLFGQAVHIGLAHFDKLDGVFVEVGEVVRGEAHLVFPLKAQPLYRVFERLDVAGVFGSYNFV